MASTILREIGGKFQAYVEVELAQLKEYLALIAGGRSSPS